MEQHVASFNTIMKELEMTHACAPYQFEALYTAFNGVVGAASSQPEDEPQDEPEDGPPPLTPKSSNDAFMLGVRATVVSAAMPRLTPRAAAALFELHPLKKHIVNPVICRMCAKQGKLSIYSQATRRFRHFNAHHKPEDPMASHRDIRKMLGMKKVHRGDP